MANTKQTRKKDTASTTGPTAAATKVGGTRVSSMGSEPTSTVRNRALNMASGKTANASSGSMNKRAYKSTKEASTSRLVS